MPFNADEAAAKLGLKVPSAGAPSKFDPDKVAQSLGIQTLPNQGNIQDGATAAQDFAQEHPTLNKAMNAVSTVINPASALTRNELQKPGAADAYATHLGQGASLGFNDEASSALSALAPSANDASYLEKYTSDRDKMRQHVAETAESHPVISALAELTGGLPIAMATGNIASGMGKLAAAGVSAAMSGLNGLGKSNKDSLGQAAADTAMPASLSLAASAIGNVGALKNFITDKYKTFFNPEVGQEVIDKLNPANVGATVNARPNGDFDIKFGTEGEKVGQALKIGKEEGKLLTNPDVQAKITDEVNNVFGTQERPGIIPNLLNETKQDLGNIRDPLLKQFGANSTNAQPALKSVWDKAQTFDHGGDQDALHAINDFKERLQNVELRLRAASPTGNINDVPLSVAFAQKQELGDKIFEQGLYRKSPAIQRMAKQLYAGLRDATDAADNTGQLKKVNDAFHAVYGMSENSIDAPKKLEALTSPTANAARNAYKDFVAPMLKLDPNDRAALMPKMQEYLATEFPITLNKQSILKAVTSKTDAKGAIGWTLNKMYLNKGAVMNGATGLGALQTNAPAALDAISPALNAAASNPSLNSLPVQQQAPQQQQGSLGQLR